MPLYRFYRIEEDGHIKSLPEPVDCPNDETAITEAKGREDARTIEIWDLTRKVALVEPYQARVLRLKAEACRLLADISDDVTREAHWLEQSERWETLATEAPREQLKKPAPTIVMNEAWPTVAELRDPE